VPRKDLVGRRTGLSGDPLAQLEVGMLGVRPALVELPRDRVEHARQWPEESLVPVQLDHVVEVVLAPQLVEARPRFVRPEVDQLWTQ
jgi:hypothetical protein